MVRRSVAIALGIICIILIIAVGIIYYLHQIENNIPIENSETFPLSLNTPIRRMVELHKGNQLMGNFAITNIPIWNNEFWGQQTYSTRVTIVDPQNNVVLEYDSKHQASFSYTAFYSGVYTIEFSIGSEFFPPSGLENPSATLSYTVTT